MQFFSHPQGVSVGFCLKAFTVIFREIVHQVRAQDLLLQKVLLVEEQNDRGVLEPGVGDDCAKQRFAFLHAILQISGKNKQTQKRRKTTVTGIRINGQI